MWYGSYNLFSLLSFPFPSWALLKVTRFQGFEVLDLIFLPGILVFGLFLYCQALVILGSQEIGYTAHLFLFLGLEPWDGKVLRVLLSGLWSHPWDSQERPVIIHFLTINSLNGSLYVTDPPVEPKPNKNKKEKGSTMKRMSTRQRYVKRTRKKMDS